MKESRIQYFAVKQEYNAVKALLWSSSVLLSVTEQVFRSQAAEALILEFLGSHALQGVPW